MQPFKAFRIHSDKGGDDARLETIGLEDLADGDVIIRGEYSSINYKDALAATGAGKILRRYPLIGGVDIAGTVEESGDPRVPVGASVVVCGCGLSETHDGGFTQYSRVRGDWVNLLPDGLDTRTAMQIGTAGFTAAYAIHRMEQNGQRPDQGPVLVNGATGGVGSLAVDMLSGAGYSVTAMTSKDDAAEYLRAIGADEIVNLKEMELGNRPLEKATWAGAIDNLGGDVLGWLTRTTKPYGNIAAVGLAAGFALNTTVMPFILRGVSLLGINSVGVPLDERRVVWQRVAGDLAPRHLDRIATREVPLEDIKGEFQRYIDGAVVGRTIIRLS